MRAAWLVLPVPQRLRVRWTWWLRLAVTGYLCFLVWAKMQEQTYDWRSVWQTAHVGWLLAVLALLPLNLGLETLKWWLMVRRFYPWLTPRGAVVRVLAGAAAGFVTPSRWGEFAGRVLSLPAGHRTEAAWATLLSRLAQLTAAVLAGGLALVTLHPIPERLAGMALPVGGLALALSVGISLACLYPNRWLSWAVPLRWPHWLPVRQVHLAASRIPLRDRAVSLGLGMIRYAVFVLQIGLALWAYGAEVSPLVVFQFCGLLFLGKSLIPSVSMAELGVREALALVLAGWLLLPTTAVFNATLLIFAINLLLPALVGAVCVWCLTPAPAPTTTTLVSADNT